MAYSNLDDFDYKPDTYRDGRKLLSEINNRYQEIKDERVEHPSHYTSGRTEVIDVIEDAVKDAPNNNAAVLQAQVIKYILRLWLKDDPHEDACKARWYLNRLIDKLTIDTDS